MATLFLIYALWQKNNPLKRFSLLVLIATAATAVPVYLTGEPAENIVKHFPGVSMDLIEAHEDSAEFSLIVTLVCGALAITTLLFQKRVVVAKLLTKATIFAALIAVVSLGYTANLGGKIRHPEIVDINSQKVNQNLDMKNGTKNAQLSVADKASERMTKKNQ